MLYRFIILFMASSVFAEPLILGRISDNASKTVESMKPVGEFILNGWQDSRFDSVEIFVAEDSESMITAVLEGKVHWVTESAFTASILIHEANMHAALARHKKGEATYGSVLLTSNDISSAQDLVGKKIAAEDPGSFSGFFLAYKFVVELGLAVNYLNSVRAPVDEDAVNFVFSYDESNNRQWLNFGLVSGAVFSDKDYADDEFIGSGLRRKTNPLYISEQYPRTLELLSPNLTPVEQDYITQKLLTLNENLDHPVLEVYDKSTGFNLLGDEQMKQISSIYNAYLQY